MAWRHGGIAQSIFIDDFLALGGKQRVHDAAAARERRRGREAVDPPASRPWLRRPVGATLSKT
jgi:hypothetical protein